MLLYTGLNASPLLDPMLEVLGRWARKLDTANAWFRLADSAYVVSRDVTAREAATSRLCSVTPRTPARRWCWP